MKKTAFTLATAALALLGGCATEPGPFAPQDTTKYTLENTDSFVLMDKQVQYSVTSTGIQYSNLPDGRLQIVANIKNRENRRIQVQVDCIFKNDQGVATGDESPWQTLILGENTTEAVTFTSMNNQARKYTVRVRQAR
jgi:uncharacterized protein YcfL